MAGHRCAIGLQPFVLAGFLLAGFAMSGAVAKPYSSYDPRGFPLRGVTLNSPFAAAQPQSQPAPEPSYKMPPPRTPAFTPVQRGFEPRTYPALQAPSVMPQNIYTGASAPPLRFAPRRNADDDPYAPLGLRRGIFLVRPSLETAAGFDSNVNGTPTGARSSGYSRIKPDMVAESDWSNHALRLHLGAERFDYFSDEIDARTNLDLDAKLRLDIRRGTALELGLAYARTQDASALTTSTLPANALSQPDVQSVTGTAALEQKLGIFGVRVSGTSASRSFGDTELSNGVSIINDDRDVRDTVVALRGSYEWTRAVQPFLETGYNRHDYEIEQDAGGFDKGSSGITQRAGLIFDFGPTMSGEVAAGLIYQTPYEQSAESYTGITVDSAFNWSPTPLSTLRFGARTAVLDDALVGAVGGLAHDATARLEHRLRRNVTLGAGLGLGFDDYEGIVRNDLRYSAGVDAAWQVNRYAAITSKIEHRALTSSVPGEDTQGTIGEIGLKLQY